MSCTILTSTKTPNVCESRGNRQGPYSGIEEVQRVERRCIGTHHYDCRPKTIKNGGYLERNEYRV